MRNKSFKLAALVLVGLMLLVGSVGANPYGGSGAWGTGDGSSLVGPTGTKMGVYNPGTTYNVNDIVNYNGIIYVCTQSGTNQQPDISPLYWELHTAAASGADGLVQFALSGALGSDAEFTYDAATDTLSVVRMAFDATAAAPSHVAGTVYFDREHQTLNVLNIEADVEHNLGMEIFQRVYNPSVTVTIADGEAVYLSGDGVADTYGTIFPAVSLADASAGTTAGVYGVATHSIEPETWGFITTLGPVHDYDTSLWPVNTLLYLSATTPGLLTDTSPISPHYKVIVARVLRQAVAGTIGVGIHPLGNTQAASTILNGASLESVAVSATSDGATISAVIENSGGGDIYFWYDNEPLFFDATPAATVALTAGTDTVPALNYVYVVLSTGTLTANTTGYPSGVQYAPIGRFYCQSAASAATDGILMLHAETDHLTNGGGMGHLRHINQKLRLFYADYVSGMATTVTGSPGATPQVAVSAGAMYQLHAHTTPLFPAGDPIYIVNDPTTPYKRVTDLSGITQDSLGGSINNRYIACVLLVTGSETDADSQLLLNLPSGSYLSATAARDDVSKFTDYSIDTFKKGTTLLVYRLVLRNSAGTITVDYGGVGDDLRGAIPSSPGGSSVTTGVDFPDNLFRVSNVTDDSKKIALDASGITTSTVRTYAAPDANGTLALADLDNLFVSQTFLGATPLVLDGATLGTNATTFSVTDPTGARTITVPDSDQTIGTATTVLGNIVDISINTNLAVTAPVILTDDTLSVDDVFLLNTGDTGTGTYDFTGGIFAGASPFVFDGASPGGSSTTLSVTDPTAARVITVPDSDQTIGTATTLAVTVDISDDTNLVAGTNITLTDDTLNVDDAFLANTGDTGTGTYDLTGAVLAGGSPLVFEGSVVDVNDTTFTFTAQSAPQIITFPDATGTVALTSQLAGATKWTQLTATTDFSTTAPSTSTVTMVTDQTGAIDPGMAIKYTSTANGGDCYAVVESITSNLLTISGVALNTGAGDLTALYYSPLPAMVETVTFVVPGQFATATNTTVLEDFINMASGYRWPKADAYLVNMDLRVVNDDTGTQPTFNATSGGSTVFSSAVTPSDAAWTDSGVTAQRANYDIARDEALELTVTYNSGTGDLSDLNVNCTFVYK